jgi:galactokinase
MIELHRRVLQGFRQRFGINPEFIACAPGRVNLLGEHVDYNEGFVLPAAIDLVTLVAYRRSGKPCSTILSLDLLEESSFNQYSVTNKQDIFGDKFSGWVHYPAGVQWALNMEGFETPGIEAIFASEVPIGAGLSSSASVELAFGVAWENLGCWNLAPIQLAKICLKAEIEYVGLNCGIMDQFASACGVKDRVLFLDCRSLDWRLIHLPEDSEIVIADTSVRRLLTNSSYNDHHTSCQKAVQIFQEFLPGIRSLRDVGTEQFHHYKSFLPEIVAKRAEHVVSEIVRTSHAIDLLENEDLIGFGNLMNACHASLRDLYQVSCPELDTMVALAQSLPGCYGARLTGAGFGGCTVNLVSRKSAKAFSQNLAIGYTHATGLKPNIYICHAVDGARVETFRNKVQSSDE